MLSERWRKQEQHHKNSKMCKMLSTKHPKTLWTKHSELKKYKMRIITQPMMTVRARLVYVQWRSSVYCQKEWKCTCLKMSFKLQIRMKILTLRREKTGLLNWWSTRDSNSLELWNGLSRSKSVSKRQNLTMPTRPNSRNSSESDRKKRSQTF